jgi:beta-phosphoglucomutase-like phosphatase (HAD superfamily)
MAPKKNLIVFDIDGTLTDSVAHHQTAFVAALQQMNVQQINTDFKIYKHHTDSHIAKVIYELDRKKIFGMQQLELFEDLLWSQINTVNLKEIRGAMRTVNLLEQTTDFGVCYATGSLRKPATYKLNTIGLNFEPAQLVASNEIETREEIVLAAIEQAKDHYQQNSFERIISIGDGLWDLKTAQNLGLEFIGIGLVHKEVLIAQGMTLHFEDWSTFTVQHLIPAKNESSADIKIL